MGWIQILAAVAVVFVVLVALGYRRRHVGSRVLVRLDDCTVEGTLAGESRRVLVVREALVVERNRAPVDGELIIERARAIWTQVLS